MFLSRAELPRSRQQSVDIHQLFLRGRGGASVVRPSGRMNRRIKEILLAPPIVIVRRAGLPLTPAAEAFVEFMRPKTERTCENR